MGKMDRIHRWATLLCVASVGWIAGCIEDDGDAGDSEPEDSQAGDAGVGDTSVADALGDRCPQGPDQVEPTRLVWVALNNGSPSFTGAVVVTESRVEEDVTRLTLTASSRDRPIFLNLTPPWNELVAPEETLWLDAEMDEGGEWWGDEGGFVLRSAEDGPILVAVVQGSGYRDVLLRNGIKIEVGEACPRRHLPEGCYEWVVDRPLDTELAEQHVRLFPGEQEAVEFDGANYRLQVSRVITESLQVACVHENETAMEWFLLRLPVEGAP